MLYIKIKILIFGGMSIEDEIIKLLNDADANLDRSEFESLAESIIYYIDEIARSKK